MKRVLFYITAMWFLSVSVMADVKVIVSNPTNVQRQELVEISCEDICQRLGINATDFFTVRNAIGQEVGYQITYDGKLLLDASVQPGRSTVFTIAKGIPERALNYNTLPVRTKAGGFGVGKVWVHGQLYPDRLDDIAWENDRGAYRVYGPAFQKANQIGYGPDVWVKNTPELDVEKRFRMDIDMKPTEKQLTDNGHKAEWAKFNQNYSFHIDHGTGNDCYAVGASLGCGAPAVIYKGSIVYPWAWKEYEILDNGPLRFTVSLIYNDTVVGKQRLTEHRIITLDKGSNFNRMEVWYEGQTKALDVVSGFPLHSPNEGTLVTGQDFMQYADPTDNPEANSCELYIACLYPNGGVTTKSAFGHALGETVIKAGEHWTYYAGTAWSKYDVRNQQEWQCRINTTLNAFKQPLTVTIQ